MPKELQEGTPALHDSHMHGATALHEAGQGQTQIQEPGGPARHPEIQESQGVSECNLDDEPCCIMLCYSMHLLGCLLLASFYTVHNKDYSCAVFADRAWASETHGWPNKSQVDCQHAKVTCTHVLRFAQVQEGYGGGQEAGKHVAATTAAVQLHNGAGDATGGLHTAPARGPPDRADWQQPLQEQDPVSPASSSGSALDPQLFRFASVQGVSCALQESALDFTLVFHLFTSVLHLGRLTVSFTFYMYAWVWQNMAASVLCPNSRSPNVVAGL